MIGRRIPITDYRIDPATLLKQPGDYYGPIVGFNGDNPAVMFLLPITEDVPGHPEARMMHSVVSPPHRFVEEPDGTLTIYNSIGAGYPSYYWHGFLDKGRWVLER